MRVIEDYQSCYPRPLDLRVGDCIQLFERDVPKKWRGWNWCRDSEGNEGWVSETYFKRNSSGAEIVRDYVAKELSVSEDEEIELIFEDCGWAWCKSINGDQGWLPTEVLESR